MHERVIGSRGHFTTRLYLPGKALHFKKSSRGPYSTLLPFIFNFLKEQFSLIDLFISSSFMVTN